MCSVGTNVLNCTDFTVSSWIMKFNAKSERDKTYSCTLTSVHKKEVVIKSPFVTYHISNC